MTFLRKARGSRLNIFAPVSDLSSLSKSESEGSVFEAGTKNDVAVAGGQILGDEWTTHVVEVSLVIDYTRSRSKAFFPYRTVAELCYEQSIFSRFIQTFDSDFV